MMGSARETHLLVESQSLGEVRSLEDQGEVTIGVMDEAKDQGRIESFSRQHVRHVISRVRSHFAHLVISQCSAESVLQTRMRAVIVSRGGMKAVAMIIERMPGDSERKDRHDTKRNVHHETTAMMISNDSL